MIRLERSFSRPVEQVFDAFREPRTLARWAWGSLGADTEATVDFRQGGTFEVSTAHRDGTRWAMRGTYTEIVPNRRIAHTLSWNAPMGYGPVDERIVVDFAEAPGGSAIVFCHEGAFDARARDGHVKGWGNVLETLEGVLA
jgi:uncharacterized protein YndB with AHSA1/START domain